MPAPSDMIAAIRTRILTVSQTGPVLTRIPRIAKKSDLEAAFAFTPVAPDPFAALPIIRGWWVTLETSEGRWNDINGRRWIDDYTFLATGIHVFHETAPGPSEPVFLDKVEAVIEALKPDLTLGGTVETVWQPLRQRFVGHREIADVLCHVTELVLQGRRYRLRAPL